MRNFLILALALCLIGIVSCQKDEIAYTPPGGGSGTGSGSGNGVDTGNILYKIVEIDSNYVDTLTVTYYRYDAQKRISSIVEYQHSKPGDSVSTSFSYNNDADTIVKQITYGDKTGFFQKKFLSFDVSNKLTKDSTIYYSSVSSSYNISSYNYIYQGNKIIEYDLNYHTSNPTFLISKDTSYLYPVIINGNFISEKDTILNKDLTFNNRYTINNYAVTYDNHPIAKLKGLYKLYAQSQGIVLQQAANNNLITETSEEVNNTLFQFSLRYELEYYNNGYVKKGTEFYSNSLTTYQTIKGSRYFYFYK